MALSIWQKSQAQLCKVVKEQLVCLRAVGHPVPWAQLWVGLHLEMLCSLEKMLWRMICQREPPAEEGPWVWSSRNGVSPAVGLTWSSMRGSSRDPQPPAVCRGENPPSQPEQLCPELLALREGSEKLCAGAKAPVGAGGRLLGLMSPLHLHLPPAGRGRCSLSPGAQLKAV